MARLVAQAAYDIKGESIEVLDVRKLCGFTDFFVIASGRSDRQVQAMSDNIRHEMQKMKRQPIGIEGYQIGHWVLMDFGSVVAHLFFEEARTFYALEKLWGDAPRIKFQLK